MATTVDPRINDHMTRVQLRLLREVFNLVNLCNNGTISKFITVDIFEAILFLSVFYKVVLNIAPRWHNKCPN